MAAAIQTDVRELNPIDCIPDPAVVRYQIGIRSAELSLLRRLLKVAESRCRVLPSNTTTPSTPTAVAAAR